MKKIAAEIAGDSFSFSRRHFTWKNKVAEEDDAAGEAVSFDMPEQKQGKAKAKAKGESFRNFTVQVQQLSISRRKLSVAAVSKLRSALSMGAVARTPGLGSKVVGTLFGYRRGHVHFAFQDDFRQKPAFLVELATPTSFLVKEMSSGLVRIALECEKKAEKRGFKLLQEPFWRTFCNGKKCGYAMRRECGAAEWNVLNVIGPISMGAGVLPAAGDGEGELMYMRAKFERVVGSRDSEAFYMMNPDGNGGPELSVYLLRV